MLSSSSHWETWSETRVSCYRGVTLSINKQDVKRSASIGRPRDSAPDSQPPYRLRTSLYFRIGRKLEYSHLVNLCAFSYIITLLFGRRDIETGVRLSCLTLLRLGQQLTAARPF